MKRVSCAILTVLAACSLLSCDRDDVAEPQAAAAAPAIAPSVQVQNAGSTASYANFCRITGTPEEVILEFGLNPQPFGETPVSIEVNQTVILNFYTAKRLLGAMEQTVKQHEQAFGELEVDPEKRLRK